MRVVVWLLFIAILCVVLGEKPASDLKGSTSTKSGRPESQGRDKKDKPSKPKTAGTSEINSDKSTKNPQITTEPENIQADQANFGKFTTNTQVNEANPPTSEDKALEQTITEKNDSNSLDKNKEYDKNTKEDYFEKVEGNDNDKIKNENERDEDRASLEIDTESNKEKTVMNSDYNSKETIENVKNHIIFEESLSESFGKNAELEPHIDGKLDKLEVKLEVKLEEEIAKINIEEIIKEPLVTNEEIIQNPVITIDEIIQKPVITIEEIIPEPVITIDEIKQDPVIIIEDPVITIEEPVITIEDPAITIEEPVINTKEPVIVIEEPVITIEEIIHEQHVDEQNLNEDSPKIEIHVENVPSIEEISNFKDKHVELESSSCGEELYNNHSEHFYDMHDHSLSDHNSPHQEADSHFHLDEESDGIHKNDVENRVTSDENHVHETLEPEKKDINFTSNHNSKNIVVDYLILFAETTENYAINALKITQENELSRIAIFYLLSFIAIWLLLPIKKSTDYKITTESDSSYVKTLEKLIDDHYEMLEEAIMQKKSTPKEESSDAQYLSLILENLERIKDLEASFQVQVIDSHKEIWDAIDARKTPLSPPRHITLSIPFT